MFSELFEPVANFQVRKISFEPLRTRSNFDSNFQILSKFDLLHTSVYGEMRTSVSMRTGRRFLAICTVKKVPQPTPHFHGLNSISKVRACTGGFAIFAIFKVRVKDREPCRELFISKSSHNPRKRCELLVLEPQVR